MYALYYVGDTLKSTRINDEEYAKLNKSIKILVGFDLLLTSIDEIHNEGNDILYLIGSKKIDKNRLLDNIKDYFNLLNNVCNSIRNIILKYNKDKLLNYNNIVEKYIQDIESIETNKRNLQVHFEYFLNEISLILKDTMLDIVFVNLLKVLIFTEKLHIYGQLKFQDLNKNPWIPYFKEDTDNSIDGNSVHYYLLLDLFYKAEFLGVFDKYNIKVVNDRIISSHSKFNTYLEQLQSFDFFKTKEYNDIELEIDDDNDCEFDYYDDDYDDEGGDTLF